MTTELLSISMASPKAGSFCQSCGMGYSDKEVVLGKGRKAGREGSEKVSAICGQGLIEGSGYLCILSRSGFED